MAKIRNSKGDGFLTDANGNFIDSSLVENDPLDPDVTSAANVGFGDVDEVIADFFPEYDPETGKFTFDEDNEEPVSKKP